MMMATDARGFTHYFREVEDARIDRTKFHKLVDILFISVAATIAGVDGPSDIADFAKQQLTWCRKFVRLKNGVPSHDTIGRVLSLIKPDQFQVAFLDWIASFTCPSQQGITLGQVAVDAKSNEITAIPRLLTMLELEGAIISIDAVGCQKEIAAQVIREGGDYVLAVKDNQRKLREALETFFSGTSRTPRFPDLRLPSVHHDDSLAWPRRNTISHGGAAAGIVAASLPRQLVRTGRLRACTGSWMLSFAKMQAVSATELPPRITASCESL